MGEIAIFENLLYTILNEPTKQFTLFGERNLFSDKNIDHDLVFHMLENIPVRKLERPAAFIIPVLPLNEKQEYNDMCKLAKADGFIFPTMVEKEDSKYLAMYNLYKKHPFLDTFAVRPNSINASQLAEIKKGKPGESSEALLTFYRIQKVKSGKKIESQPYTGVKKEDLFSTTPPEMHLDIKKI